MVMGNLALKSKNYHLVLLTIVFFSQMPLDLDITNHAVVAAFIKTNNINVIINCAAYTAVDKAESEPELADAINHLAVKNLAFIAKECGAKLIHISTDYVFDGTGHKPYVETDITKSSICLWTN